MRIQDLPVSDRPREKMLKYGQARLNQVELLALLLHTGQPGLNVTELARRLMLRLGGQQLLQLSAQELMNQYGLGPVKACRIAAAFELSRRLLQQPSPLTLLTPADIWRELRQFRRHKKEHMIIFYLDARQVEITRELLSVGTVNATLVHPREVFEPAVRCLASSIIMVHNHPSGELQPSSDDLAITKRLVDAGSLLGIPIQDHLIISLLGWFSFKEHRLL